MTALNLEHQMTLLESALESTSTDFSAAYMTVQDLHEIFRQSPERVRPGAVSALKSLLESRTHVSQTQALFLYREAADALAAVMILSQDQTLADQAFFALRTVLNHAGENQKRAAAEALGSLPLNFRGPVLKERGENHLPGLSWDAFLRLNAVTLNGPPRWAGRSIVAQLTDRQGLLVVKTSGRPDAADSLNREALWMEVLRSERYRFPVSFEIPRPLKVGAGFVFRLTKFPEPSSGSNAADPPCSGVGYIAPGAYFQYPNDPRQGCLGKDDFREVLFRNAWLLGKLTSLGIVHCAPIPLFHNRVQRDRRADNGVYEWQRGGRLDRWLESCRYPNFGLTGIRDFEHFTAVGPGERSVYYGIGSHLLSLLLVAGSYFRHRDAERRGLDPMGRPVDARNLFDQPFFKHLIHGVFSNYYSGFVGVPQAEETPVDLDEFTGRLVEEMGVDRHMEEILRVVDQRDMTEEGFREFLLRRGLTPEQIAGLRKGSRDISVFSGPHLGGFNQRISVPELTEFLSKASAYCISAKYRNDQAPGATPCRTP